MTWWLLNPKYSYLLWHVILSQSIFLCDPVFHIGILLYIISWLQSKTISNVENWKLEKDTNLTIYLSHIILLSWDKYFLSLGLYLSNNMNVTEKL